MGMSIEIEHPIVEPIVTMKMDYSDAKELLILLTGINKTSRHAVCQYHLDDQKLLKIREMLADAIDMEDIPVKERTAAKECTKIIIDGIFNSNYNVKEVQTIIESFFYGNPKER